MTQKESRRKRAGFAGLGGVVLSMAVGNTAPLAEYPVALTSGLVDYQVLQRSSNNQARTEVAGSIGSIRAGIVEVRLLRRGRTVVPFDWLKVGKMKEGRWEATLDKIPTGGPYDLQFRFRDEEGHLLGRASVHQILVGDLWVLGGQSNMHGRGSLQGAVSPNEQVHSFDLSDRWQVAKEPVGISFNATDLVHAARDQNGQRIQRTAEEIARLEGNQTTGTGPGLAFASRLVEHTGVPVGLIPCALGGSSLEQWNADHKKQGGGSLYGAMLRRTQAVGGRVAGMLWYQGETDAIQEAAAPLYLQGFRRLVASIRADLNHPSLPFYYVQIGRFIGSDAEGINTVRVAQLEAEAQMEKVGMTTAIDLGLRDPVHIDTPGVNRIGARLANLACRELFPDVDYCVQVRPGPRPASATLREDGILRVVFQGVNGRLMAPGRAVGFSIRDSDQRDLQRVFHVDLDVAEPDVASLKVGRDLPADAYLWYGWGDNPYCNIADERDLAVPAFGPLVIGRE